MSEPTQAEIAEIASELALAIHDVASALKHSAWVLVHLTDGDDAGLLVEQLRDVADRAYNISYALQHGPLQSAEVGERSVLASASYAAQAVSEAIGGLQTAAWAAVRLGGDKDARPLLEPLAAAKVRAAEYSLALRTRPSALPHLGEEVDQ